MITGRTDSENAQDSLGTRRYMLENEHLESIYDDTGKLRAEYLRGVVIDEIVNGYEIDSNGAKSNLTFHHDQVQSVSALTGHAGGALETIEYSPFGDVVSTTGTSSNQQRYTGREADPDTVGSLYSSGESLAV